MLESRSECYESMEEQSLLDDREVFEEVTHQLIPYQAMHVHDYFFSYETPPCVP